MRCSVCASTLATSEIRDRNGTPFVTWECPRVQHHTRPPNQRDGPLWSTFGPASPVLVPGLVALATMLVSF